VVAVTRDAELNEISDTNKNNSGGVKVSWEATPDLSDSVRTTTNKGMSKIIHARTISPDFDVFKK